MLDLYKVGEKVLLECIIQAPRDEDGDYEVKLPTGCDDTWVYAKEDAILGRAECFERTKNEPLQIGDVLKKADISCVIIKETSCGFNVLFSDGSSGFRTVPALEEGFERTGINLGDNVEEIIKTLTKVKEVV